VIPLPIDSHLPSIAASLVTHPNLVLSAEPGAGKTTRVPPHLLSSIQGEIWVLEPRRLAARLSAMRVAEERGERLGDSVGYQVRFEEVSGPKTRLRYLTEGILLRRLLREPALPCVGAVILDEFHERSLQVDLALALLWRLQRTARPDLKLVVMSATLDAQPLQSYLGDSPLVSVPGRLFPVEIDHERVADSRPLEIKVAAAVRRALTESEGDVLVFLPGAAEIRRCAEACAAYATKDLAVLPLHGSLPPAEQDRAVRPSPGRKVILATNVAETSSTLEGVRVVIDSGLARLAGHSPWSGLPSLRVGKVSQASCTQRAGRAGRTAPGRCYRLFTKLDHDSRPPFTAPEVRSADLSETVLTLHALEVSDPRAFAWFEAPNPETLEAAEDLLRLLGSIDATGLTALGRRMVQLPLHPRLSRLLLEAAAQGLPDEGAALAAVLSERDGRGADGTDRSGDSDPLEQVERAGRGEPAQRARRQLRRLIESSARSSSPLPRSGQGREGGPRDRSDHERLLRALLLAYPDRVARRRRPGGRELLMSQGGTATLSPRSAVKDAEWLVAVDGEEQRKSGQSALGTVFSASAIEKDWLLEMFPDRVREEATMVFNAEAERVEVLERWVYGPAALVLEESRGAGDADAVAETLVRAAQARGAETFSPPDELARLVGRVDFVARMHPEAGLPTLSGPQGEAAIRQGLLRLAVGRRSFAEMREQSLVDQLLAALSPSQQALLARVAPPSLILGGRRSAISYEPDKPPWIAVRMADLFGLTDGPRIGEGRIPLTLHLLAPNGRAVQVTSDLKGFWERTYPAVRRELSRRYPRHPWPEDPRLPLNPRNRPKSRKPGD
jgi:ATP-dependent helicase HrpB